MTCYNSETRAIDGRTFRVEWEYDHHHGSPQTESDGHGVIVEAGPYFIDEADDPEHMEENYGDDAMEETIRRRMAVRLTRGERRTPVLYYDVWATLRVAKEEGWGVTNPVGLTPDERAMEAVEQDYTYIAGWYNDEWHWCGIVVTEVLTDGEGDEEDGRSESLWGLCSNDHDYHEEVIKELVAQMPVEALS